MSTIALKNKAANHKNRKTIIERIRDYFTENHNAIVLGIYAYSGTTPDVEMLREMKIV